MPTFMQVQKEFFDGICELQNGFVFANMFIVQKDNGNQSILFLLSLSSFNQIRNFYLNHSANVKMQMQWKNMGFFCESKIWREGLLFQCKQQPFDKTRLSSRAG
jgi:hypothetical protein